MNSRPIFCFGEILWDALPAGLFPGGAPINVAYHLKRLGRRPVPVTAVGDDFLGQELLRRVARWGLESDAIMVHPDKPTGAVQVELSEGGIPKFTILENVAWDSIGLTDWARKAEAEAIIFGSLAQRSVANRQTLAELCRLAPRARKIFDVNLRPPFVERARVLAWAQESDLIKLNHDELFALLGQGGATRPGIGIDEIERAARAFPARCDSLCVTAGPLGAGWLDQGRWSWCQARPVEVRDTVGAGDAFLAALVDGWLNGPDEPEEILDRACRLAEFVATKDGATPPYSISASGEILQANGA